MDMADQGAQQRDLIEYKAAAHALGCLTFEARLDRALDELRAMLLAKNLAYGNSALDPVRIFSAASPVEQIKVRLDDKLSRAVRGIDQGENVADDFVGYFVLLMIARQIEIEKAEGAP